jgi:hypothetical protein
MTVRRLSSQLNHAQWTRRLAADRVRAERNQTLEQRAITQVVVTRALELGAEGFALTGSTARRRRTTTSDLDYHVIGPRPDVTDLPGDVDLVATSAARFRAQLISGDDFAQWTLRCGCILHDAGVMREGARLVSEKQLWPSADRKLKGLTDHRREAERLIGMGDRDAAQHQIRAALTTAARGILLSAGVFPLSRGELSGQLTRAGHAPLARALAETIHGEPDLNGLADSLQLLDPALISVAGTVA